MIAKNGIADQETVVNAGRINQIDQSPIKNSIKCS